MPEKPKSRESILDTASKLFFMQGYHGTGLNQIIKESHCPKGSLYYYFPEGKEELAMECINRTKHFVSERWKELFIAVKDPSEAIQTFIESMASDAKESNFESFMPFSFWMAVETSAISNLLRETCKSVFNEWQSIISERLQQEGIDIDRADETAMIILSSIEGSLIHAQTLKDTKPILMASKYVTILLNNVLVKR
ncbi:TetR/AcrR family transcriptional regulator [Paenibacillus pini]|uniref:Transcriptional regulator n=1 Tax=Paenibacillus pini JCM 16418 TaxID=1236976 RepID=W7YJ83_9BACL|nr:TetR/AcrR family transcriptional regulator [Paenibacillus pini]GAF07653.1 transcriptional regulator [Paenibacillus pini JCM 16418]